VTPDLWVAKHPWWPHAAEIRVGLAKHTDYPEVPHLTRRDYGPELVELAHFALWLYWFEHGKLGARPAFDARVPKWAWDVLAKYQAHHRKPPPKPPAPEPVSIWKHPPVLGLGFETAWEFTSGQYSPEQLAWRIKRAGGTNWSIEAMPAHNEDWFDRFVAAGKANELKNLVWMRADAWQGDVPPSWEAIQELLGGHDWDGVGADIEVFPIYDPELPAKITETFPSLYRTTIVAGMADALFYADWEKHGWDCKTEAYSANIGQPPVPGVAGAVDNDAFWRGFPRNAVPAPANWGGHGSGPHTIPILEINLEGNPGVEEQLAAVEAWGRNYSHWIAGSLADADWAVYTP